MAQWRLDFRVDVGVFEDDDARDILSLVSKVEPRPIRAVFEGGIVEMTFVCVGKTLGEAHKEQARIHDALSKYVEALEFDAPVKFE